MVQLYKTSVVPPFQGSSIDLFHPQGFTLGFVVPAFQAWSEVDLNPSNEL